MRLNQTFLNKITALSLCVLGVAMLPSCRDTDLPGGETPEPQNEDQLSFVVPKISNWWSRGGDSRDIFPNDFIIYNVDIDNVRYPANFIEKGKDYDPVLSTLEYDNRRFNKYFHQYYDPKDPESWVSAGNHVHIETNPDADRHPNQGTDTQSRSLPADYVLPMEGLDGNPETYGRMTVNTVEMTDEIMSRLRCSPYSSRGTLVDETNIRNEYREIGVTGICFYPENDDDSNPIPFDLLADKVMLMDNERVSYNNADLWNTTSSNWFWSEIVGKAHKVRFFAYAPYSLNGNPNVNFHETGYNTPKFDYHVSESVDDHIDISAVAVTTPGNYYHSVPLQFNHLLTGVRFLVDDREMANNIASITIRGVHGDGTYTWSLDPNDLSTSADDNTFLKGKWQVTDEDHNREFTLSREKGDFVNAFRDNIFGFDEDGDRWQITDNDKLWLMMPQDLPEGAEIIVTFNEEAHLDPLVGRIDMVPDPTKPDDPDAKVKGVWEPGTIVTYLITTFDIDYVLHLVKDGGLYPRTGGFDDLTVVSYAVYYQKGHKNEAPKKVVPVEWHPVFYDQNNNEIPCPDWVNVTYDRPATAPLEYKDPKDINPITNFDETNVLHGHVWVGAQDVMMLDPHYRTLREAAEIGTVDDPVDISTLSGTEVGPMNTSNCYIINAPGYYKIPLVYGNGIRNGAVNSQAYTAVSYPNPFVTHNGDNIVDPWIKNNGITIKDATWISTSANHSVQLVHLDDDYLTIYVDATFIDQGNTHLAVRDENGNIAWSWHIWTTDYNPYLPSNLRTLQASSTGTVESFDFMTINLGWHYPENGSAVGPRIIKWRPMQMCTGKGENVERTTPNYYYICLPGYTPTRGAAPYYNWGRKDPIMSGVYTPADKPLWTDNSSVELTWSFNPIITNSELTSATNSGHTFRLTDGFWYLWQPNFAEAISVPWFEVTAYNVKEPGATGNFKYLPWWNYAEKSMTPIKASDGGKSWTTFHGYIMEDVEEHNDLWCAQQTEPSYLANHPNNVIKTIYDPCPPGFCVPPARAFESLTEMMATSSNHPDWTFQQYMQQNQNTLSVGYTFFTSAMAKYSDDMSDKSTINLPATTFLSWRASSWDSSGYIFCFPFLSSYMNNMCTLWSADVVKFTHSTNSVNIGGIFNINLNFTSNKTINSTEGAGKTALRLIDDTGVGPMASANGRQVRAIKEK